MVTISSPTTPAGSRMAWCAAAVCGVYGLVHVWWALAGAPLSFDGSESIFPGGWMPVVPAAVAALASAALAVRTTDRLLVPVLAALAGAAMIAYCMLAWISVLMLLMVPFGLPVTASDAGLLVTRVTGAVGGGLAIRTAFVRCRAGRPKCGRCGGSQADGGRRLDTTAWWGYAGAYLVVAGLVARLVPELPRFVAEGVSGPGGVGFQLFVAGMVVAGTVLPLALVHRWGRVWPGWVHPWAGRAVPRLLVLGPGLFMGTGLVAYFIIGGFGAILSGRQTADPVGLVMIGGYAVWGIGLLVASASYACTTRSECKCAVPPRSR